MPEAKVLRYAGSASGKAYEWWREEFGRQVLQCDIVPLAEGRVDVAIEFLRLPRANLVTVDGTTLKFATLGKSDDLVLLMPTTATLRVDDSGKSTQVESSVFSLADAGNTKFSVARVAPGRYHTVFFDRRALLDVSPHVENALARPFMGKEALFRLYCGYYESIQSHATNLDAEALHLASQHLLDLAALIFGGRADAVDLARARGLSAVRLEAIKADVLGSLSDVGLSLGEIARRHRMSVRYVQLMFERHGTSFIEFLVEQRLMCAHRLLGNPQHGGRKIADIALQSGFANLSNFNRAYRRRFGETPSDTRERVKRISPTG